MPDKNDEPEFEPAGSIADAFATDDIEAALVAMRDYIGRELDGNRCKTCRMSQLRTGDQAALLLRGQKIIEDLETYRRGRIKPNEEKPTLPEGVLDFDSIRNRRPADREPDPEDSHGSELGTKAAPRRSGPGRRKSGT